MRAEPHALLAAYPSPGSARSGYHFFPWKKPETPRRPQLAREHFERITHRNRIFEFGSRHPDGNALDSKESVGPGDPDSDRAILVAREITLFDRNASALPPNFSDYQELPLDFDAHVFIVARLSPTGTSEMSFQAEEGGRSGGAIVTFEPGARTNWHTHPAGQTLVVLSGVDRGSTRHLFRSKWRDTRRAVSGLIGVAVAPKALAHRDGYLAL